METHNASFNIKLIISIVLDIVISMALIKASEDRYKDYLNHQSSFKTLNLTGLPMPHKLFKRNFFNQILSKAENPISNVPKLPNFDPEMLMLIKVSASKLESFLYTSYMKIYFNAICLMVVALLTVVFIVMELY